MSPFTLDVIVRASALLAVAAVADLGLRRRASAATRHLVWTLAIGALLALPVAAAIRMLIEELRVELPGDDSEHPGVRETDARAEREYERKAAGAPPEEAAAVAAEIVDKKAVGRPHS